MSDQVFLAANSNQPTSEPWVYKVNLGSLDQSLGGIGEPRGRQKDKITGF